MYLLLLLLKYVAFIGKMNVLKNLRQEQ